MSGSGREQVLPGAQRHGDSGVPGNAVADQASAGSTTRRDGEARRRAANRRFALSLAVVAGMMLVLTLVTGVMIHLADISALIL